MISKGNLDPLSVELFQQVFEEANIGLVILSRKSLSTISMNKMASNLLSVLPTEQVGQSFSTFFTNTARNHLKPFTVGLLNQSGHYQNVLVQKKDKVKFIANLSVRILHIGEEAQILLTLQDVTLQQKLQRELTTKQNEVERAFEEQIQQNLKLKELDKAKDRFIALTTHELRTPLAAMLSSAEILKLGLFDTTEEHDSFVAMIHDQGLKLQELVNDILDFAKIQAGKMDYFIQENSMLPLLKSLTAQFLPLAKSSNVTLTTDFPEEGLNCYFDELRLQQILSNIIANGIKYNRNPGHLKIEIRETVKHIEVHIVDSGKGIPDSDRQAIYSEFETLGNISKHQRGTGLGLPITKKLIEGMGGKIGLESVMGEGSRFWVEVPKEKLLSEECYRNRPTDEFDLAA